MVEELDIGKSGMYMKTGLPNLIVLLFKLLVYASNAVAALFYVYSVDS